MNSKSKWETTSAEYGLLDGEYVNLIGTEDSRTKGTTVTLMIGPVLESLKATMCVTDPNNRPFTFKPIPLPEDIQEDVVEVQEDNDQDDETVMADKGKIFLYFYREVYLYRYINGVV